MKTVARVIYLFTAIIGYTAALIVLVVGIVGVCGGLNVDIPAFFGFVNYPELFYIIPIVIAVLDMGYSTTYLIGFFNINKENPSLAFHIFLLILSIFFATTWGFVGSAIALVYLVEDKRMTL